MICVDVEMVPNNVHAFPHVHYINEFLIGENIFFLLFFISAFSDFAFCVLSISLLQHFTVHLPKKIQTKDLRFLALVFLFVQFSFRLTVSFLGSVFFFQLSRQIQRKTTISIIA